ncbi:MAG: DUF4861 domain-containing protein [Bacteroidetes bacterium]|nr:DUF4861 domain-containing protein [Bacteroidota bacterium]
MRKATMRGLLIVATSIILVQPGVQAQSFVVSVSNPTDSDRPDEVIELDWTTVTEHDTSFSEKRARVVDAGTGDEVLSQVLDRDADGTPDALLFLVSLWSNETRAYRVEARGRGELKPRVDVMHDAYRDDVAWESDRIAFRTYGRGLWEADEFEPLVSSGIDVWAKRVRDLIVRKWYGKGYAEYHVDSGEGADFYSVGPTLGAGGTAVFVGDELIRAENFADYRIIAEGPIRIIFELIYPKRADSELSITETKRITMDAGQYLFKSESTFQTADGGELDYAVGFVKRKEGVVGSSKRSTAGWMWLSVWGPMERNNGGHGNLGTAALLPTARVLDVDETDDYYLARLRAKSGEPTVQYVGAGWTASGDFTSVEDWWDMLDRFAARLEHPFGVTVK